VDEIQSGLAWLAQARSRPDEQGADPHAGVQDGL
jgi:hypothetical protein